MKQGFPLGRYRDYQKTEIAASPKALPVLRAGSSSAALAR
jgi:hypothetical protein